MNAKTPTPTPTYSLTELCLLADMPLRTVRYYVQLGLVDRPEGETRAARYGASHLEQLLLIKKWRAAGLALERISELLKGGEAPIRPPRAASGSVAVRSHILVTDGLEVVVEPGRAGLSPEQLRSFVKGVTSAFDEAISTNKPASINKGD